MVNNNWGRPVIGVREKRVEGWRQYRLLVEKLGSAQEICTLQGSFTAFRMTL
jgi:hypothetical protein